jgi:hypothetical protein
MESCGQPTVIIGNDGKVAANVVYYNMTPVFFLGKYDNVCGGCDTIKTQDMVCSLVRHFSQFGHVIFEGLLISHSFQRYFDLSKELEKFGIPTTFAFMDTSKEVCIERVKSRRLAKGNEKEFNTHNTETAYDSTWGTYEKLRSAGAKVVKIDHTKDPVIQISKILDSDNQYLFEHSYRENRY